MSPDLIRGSSRAITPEIAANAGNPVTGTLKYREIDVARYQPPKALTGSQRRPRAKAGTR